jgi:hypothetical protein
LLFLTQFLLFATVRITSTYFVFATQTPVPSKNLAEIKVFIHQILCSDSHNPPYFLRRHTYYKGGKREVPVAFGTRPSGRFNCQSGQDVSRIKNLTNDRQLNQCEAVLDCASPLAL